MNLETLNISDKSLGKGGFGTVFLGQSDKKKVAAKRLTQSEREFDTLIREASRLNKLRYGKHIAYIYGITSRIKKLYMVMEYSEHGDLQSYLKRNAGSITYEKKILFCCGILLGLLYCHSMKIFHGDIKCSNVILGENLEPKLTDFGLSMTVDDIEGYCKMYEGSMHWAAPELFSMEDESDFKKFKTNPYPTDVYSLGATFCKVLYDGTTEFVDSKDIEMDISLGIASPIPKDAFLEEIINKCCQFERNERISLEDCLLLLDAIAEEQFSSSTISNKWNHFQLIFSKWKRIIRSIKAKPKTELPPLFILCRPAENFVVGSSNLSLLEWLCINDCKDAVEYMIYLHKPEQERIEWLYNISKLCNSSKVVNFLENIAPYKRHTPLHLLNLIDNNPWQFIRAFIKAGANCVNYDLLKKAIAGHHNIVVQTIVDGGIHLSNWVIYKAIESGNVEAVKIFTTAAVDLKKENEKGNTPLLAAIETGNVEIVRILLESNADIHNGSQHTPLHLAALKGNCAMTELLINAEATMNTESSAWKSLAQQLKQQGRLDMIQLILNIRNKSSAEIEGKLTLLCGAIKEKKVDTVRNLIDGGADIGEHNYDRYAPLHWAAITGSEEATMLLIKAGADLDIRTPNEERNFYVSSSPDYFNRCAPIHIAAIKGHLRIVRLLIESGADFSAKNGLGQTIIEAAAEENRKNMEKIVQEIAPTNTASLRRAAGSMSLETVRVLLNRQQVSVDALSDCLCVAAYNGSNEVVKYMIKCGANINKKYKNKGSLEWAISAGNIQAAHVLISAGADLNIKSSYERTLLFRFASQPQTETIQFLIDKGADVNARDIFGYTPIYFTTSKKAAEVLVRADADLNVISNDRENVLSYYVKKSQTEIVRFLVNAGAVIGKIDSDGRAPIQYAKSREVADILFNTGIDINARYQYKRIILFQYVEESHTEMVQLLIDRGIDINARDKYKNTALYYVKKKEIAETLINGDADINLVGQYGRTPLFEFVEKSQTEIIRLLVDKKADANAKDKYGNSPIHYAKRKEIVEILASHGAEINTKDKNGRVLFDILVKGQSENLGYAKNEKKGICELMEYLRTQK